MNGKSVKQRQYPEVAAGGFSRVDGTILFYQRVNALHSPEQTVLDVGAGRGRAHLDDPVQYRRQLMNFKDRSHRVIGLDVDPVVKGNPSINEAYLIVDGRFPLDDSSVDLIICDYTLEHVDDPKKFCFEIQRVLKPGGWFCARTPNKYGYISIAARTIPNRLHEFVLKMVQPNRKIYDVFPTKYLLNTKRSIENHLPKSTWEHYIYFWNSEPAYVGSSSLIWSIMRFITKFLPPAMGTTMHVFSRKKLNQINGGLGQS